MPRQPTPEELSGLASCPTIAEAKRRFSASHETVRYWLDECGGVLANGNAAQQRWDEYSQPPDPTRPLPGTQEQIWDIPPEATFDHGMWQLFEQLQDEMNKLDIEEDEVTVRIDDDKPIMVMASGDWHVGHVNCSMSELRRDLETIRDNEGVHTILLGDLLENVNTSVASRGMHHQQLHPSRIAKELVDDAVHYLGKDKVISMILGNHDAWSISSDDFDPIAYLAKKLGVPYLGAFGHINIHLQEQRYRILAAHMFRMRSSFNKSHQAKRLMDFVSTGEIDAVFTGHTHDSTAEHTHVRQHRTFFGQIGTYQKHSRYSKALGFTPSTREMPGVVIFPDKHKVIGTYDSLNDGVFILNAYRDQYKA